MEYLSSILYLLPLMFVAGVVDGIAGGGGIIALPAYIMSGMPIHSCYACNKLQSGLGTATSCFKYIKEGFIDIKTALIALPFTVATSFLSTKIVLFLDSDKVKIIIMVCIPIAVAMMFLKLKITSKPIYKNALNLKTILLSALSGVILGTYDALFGPGGGTVAMIIYALFLNYDLRVGCGNGKIIIVVSNITAMISYILNGYMIFYIAVPSAISNMIGSYVGASLAVRKGQRLVIPVMIFVLVCVIIQTVFNFAM